MLILSISIFILAILLGAYLLSHVMRNRATPKIIVFLHGPIAILGLVILIIYSLTLANPPMMSIILFIVAAIGGLTLFICDMKGKSFPKWLVLAHGALALLGFLSLIIYAITYSP